MDTTIMDTTIVDMDTTTMSPPQKKRGRPKKLPIVDKEKRPRGRPKGTPNSKKSVTPVKKTNDASPHGNKNAKPSSQSTSPVSSVSSDSSGKTVVFSRGKSGAVPTRSIVASPTSTDMKPSIDEFMQTHDIYFNVRVSVNGMQRLMAENRIRTMYGEFFLHDDE